MRRGQRYLLLRIEGASFADPGDAKRALKAGLSSLVGAAGLGRAGYRFVREKYSQERGIAVVKTSIAGLLPVRAALCLLSNLSGKRAKVDVLRVSGTIRGVLKEEAGK